ncbi:hypothetical protein ASE07_05930 [Noviherbaspirillum sp. Root189]|nr:hypothetical protein ASE07_05930 [Noviherbaspirillum sp. Root189]
MARTGGAGDGAGAGGSGIRMMVAGTARRPVRGSAERVGVDDLSVVTGARGAAEASVAAGAAAGSLGTGLFCMLRSLGSTELQAVRISAVVRKRTGVLKLTPAEMKASVHYRWTKPIRKLSARRPAGTCVLPQQIQENRRTRDG